MRLTGILLCALALGIAQPAPVCAAPSTAAKELSETKERLSIEAMEALVAEPLKLAREGDMLAADRALERLLEERRRRDGPASVAVADTLTSFMVLLFNNEKRRQAMTYGPRVLDAVRQAWGSDHLEYALVLNDLAQMDSELNGDAVSPESEAALLEVYRIRTDRLGEKHRETISTLVYLGKIQGLRSRTGGTIAGATRAIATLRKAIADSEETRRPGDNDNLWARSVLAETYARNGALDASLQAYQKMLEVAAGQDALDEISPVFFAAALEEGGFEAEAKAILVPYFEKLGIAPPKLNPN